jgi:hypothetical protein
MDLRWELRFQRGFNMLRKKTGRFPHASLRGEKSRLAVRHFLEAGTVLNHHVASPRHQ